MIQSYLLLMNNTNKLKSKKVNRKMSDREMVKFLKEMEKKKEERSIKGTKIFKPIYPEDDKCVYCRGDYPVDATIFSVLLKNGVVIAPICDVCLGENMMQDPNAVKVITNITKEV